MHKCMCLLACMRACVRACAYVHACVCAYTGVLVYICACMCTCVCLHVRGVEDISCKSINLLWELSVITLNNIYLAISSFIMMLHLPYKTIYSVVSHMSERYSK